MLQLLAANGVVSAFSCWSLGSRQGREAVLAKWMFIVEQGFHLVPTSRERETKVFLQNVILIEIYLLLERGLELPTVPPNHLY